MQGWGVRARRSLNKMLILALTIHTLSSKHSPLGLRKRGKLTGEFSWACASFGGCATLHFMLCIQNVECTVFV